MFRMLGPAFAAALSGAAVLLAGLAGACDASDPGASEEAGPPWFEECAAARGIDFVHRSGREGDRLLLPEIMCGGVALFDADGDGDLDVYLVQAGGVESAPEARPGNRLYLNRGDGTFVDATTGSGAEVRGYGMGVATGDYDDDGRPDLYVTNVGRNALLHNEGGGRFTDVTAQAGVGGEGWHSSAAFFDYDRDGDLDLVVARYVTWSADTERRCESPLGGADYCSPKSYRAPSAALLFRNDGGGRFVDVTEPSGIGAAFGNGLGVVTADFDGDGFQDVFVANDGTPNHLWINRRDGTFVERALVSGCAMDTQGLAKAGMGVVACDFDDDGDMDLLVTNLQGETESLFLNERGLFLDRTASAGLGAASRRFTRFGVGAYDFDQDGFLDLFVATGRVTRAPSPFTSDPYAEPNLLFRGTAPARFAEVRPRGGVARPPALTTRGAAFGDVDGDGAIDVVVVNRDAPAQLLRDRVSNRGHRLSLRVLEKSGRDALGAVVSLRIGDRTITRIVHTAESYCSASDPTVHVGLGEATRVADVRVRWVDGASEVFPVDGVDRVVTLRRGAGTSR